jgi:predicted glutamine amidotransferase
MCRMLGLLEPHSTSAEPWLVETDHSLLHLSNGSPSSLQADGWGIAWSDPRRGVQLVKGTAPVFEPAEAARFREAAREAKAPLIIGHVRKASNPMGLAHDRLIALENSQPFVHGTTVFAHNGTLPFPTQTKPRLGKFEGRITGVNDSEVLFWLLVRHLEETDDPVQAYVRTVADLVDVWQAQGSPSKGPYTGLNVLLSRTPDELWAFCLYRGEHGTALMDAGRPYFDFAYRADPKSLLIGSEPLDSTRRDWESVRDGQFLHAHASHGSVSVRTGAIPVPAEAGGRA